MAQPDTLYHYCSLSTLIGIAENRCIWLSSIHFLNDNLEHHWFRNLAIEQIENRQAEILDGIGSRWDDWGWVDEERRKIDFLHELKDGIEQRDKYSHDFCGCFSELPDSLSQWRGYGDDGCGFAIGFDREALLYDPGVKLVQLSYDKLSQQLKVSKKISLLVESWKEEPDKKGQLQNEFLDELWSIAPTCKNTAFHEEREWRVIYSPERAISKFVLTRGPGFSDYRQRHRELIPYYKWPFPAGHDHVIKEIYYGPKNPSKEQEIAVKHMLQVNGFVNIEFRHSKASYR